MVKLPKGTNQLHKAILLSMMVTASFPFVATALDGQHALIIGGGCEDDRSRFCQRSNDNTFPSYCEPPLMSGNARYNLFRPHIDFARQALVRNGWRTRIQYANSSWDSPWPNTIPFTRGQLFNALEEEITARPSKFVLNIETHGASNPHAICLGDGTMLPVGELYPFLERLRNGGTQVAVIDSSCYSGASVNEFSALDICTVSGTGESTPGYNSFNSLLFSTGMPRNAMVPNALPTDISNLRPSGNADLNGDGRISLNEAFAFARIHNDAPTAPSISSCSVTSQDLVHQIDRANQFLLDTFESPVSSEYPGFNEFIMQNIPFYQRRSQIGVCALDRIAISFAGIWKWLRENNSILLVSEFHTLGLPLSEREIYGLVTRLQQISSEYRQNQGAWQQIAAESDAAIRLNRSMPEFDRRATELTAISRHLRAEMMEILRPIQHIACSQNANAAEVRRRAACEGFDLFSAAGAQ